MDTARLRGTTLVFDLDGTLVHTAPDLLNALNHVLGGISLAPRALEEVLPYISYGARRMIVEALKISGSERSDLEVEGLLNIFLEHYAENIAVDSQPYPGIVDLLGKVRENGARLAVCTNKREALSKLLLGQLAMDDLFHGLAGRDTFPVCKPDPKHLWGAIDLAGGARERAVMVGDSGTDIATAKAAGIPVIAVDFGYSDPPVRELDPDIIISSYSEFPAALERLIPAA
jgi:phosphoglycolate phosphatase